MAQKMGARLEWGQVLLRALPTFRRQAGQFAGGCMSPVIFWFRNDLRLHDQPALHAALAQGSRHLLPVLCLPDAASPTPWGFARIGPHRRAWLVSAIHGLRQALQQCGCPLLVCPGPAASVLPALAGAVGASEVLCEAIAAPYEQAEENALRAAGLAVHTIWQSSLLELAKLPFSVQQLPPVFTPFRHAVEQAGLQPPTPLPPPTSLPPLAAGRARSLPGRPGRCPGGLCRPAPCG